MINRKELAICKRRGHSGTDYGEGWMQCKWCGIWRRRVVEVEEREDEPPFSPNLVAGQAAAASMGFESRSPTLL